jgi:nitroimidazol reductase NimA-like FMN-containing flavoprotein (pyridoxamine 5'-phosphate oxidase superfamily)
MGVLPHDECLARLAGARVGRIAFVSAGDPVILPVNHEMDGESIVFRTANGTKLLAADSEQPVAFEVDGFDADRRAGWSVMVRGVATTVEDQEEVKRLNLLGVWPWADLIERTHWVRVRTYSMTGRQTVHPAR